MTTATSDFLAAATASANPDSSFDHNLDPSAKLICTLVPARSCLNPFRGEIPLFEELKKT